MAVDKCRKQYFLPSDDKNRVGGVAIEITRILPLVVIKKEGSSIIMWFYSTVNEAYVFTIGDVTIFR